MKHRIRRSAIALLAACSIGPTAYACWAAMPLEDIVKQNTLVVVGKIEKVVVVKPRGYESGRDTAFIKIRKVLKNNTKNANIKVGTVVRLSMPSINNKARLSTDLLYKRGTDGIWLLSYDQRLKGFTIGRPDELQPLNKEQEIKGIISGKAKAAK